MSNSTLTSSSSMEIRKKVGLLMVISFLARWAVAQFTELGNDEVYYWTYALMPDISHFDHPPLVGWLIRMTTLNLTWTSEIFVRLSAVLIGTGNIWIFYRIGTYLKDELTGWYAALLYTASVYCSIIAGAFILPDTPQSVFWLLGLFAFIKAFNPESRVELAGKQLLLAGLWSGLAMYSKYHGVFLWMGALLYITLYDRKWWLRWELWAAGILSLLIFSPVFVWNFQNDFISFTFHGERVDPGSGFKPHYLLQALIGQIAYNNPINSVLCMIALGAFFKGKIPKTPSNRLLVWMGLPLILLFTGVAFFRQILPHWTSPAFFSLMLLAAIWFRQKENPVFWPKALVWANGLVLFTIVLGLIQINSGFIPLSHETEENRVGRGDITLDMQSWSDLKAPFAAFLEEEKAKGQYLGDKMLSPKWFPAAHLDYYVATPLQLKMMGGGSLLDTHQYAWLTEKRGGLVKGESAYYITPSSMFKDPIPYYGSHFEKVELATVIPVFRGGKLARNFFVYRLVNAKESLHPFDRDYWQ
ncbi:glycosyltransferase family 39 protein [Persicobacter sp. CCB-QB2]|uniref:ArnT family glycosyltransferase n=1 Tax=Persicobacter sp. CCB-QB2 TaxID=1561025 RepID=UPI0009E36146|nr:glycosyltransferase family 39 protein [Persicobacter sp. CCB-QB2]